MANLVQEVYAAIEPYAKVEVGLSGKSAEWFAPSVEAWVEAAIADMQNKGVDDAAFKADSQHFPIVRAAVLCKVKAMFGRDNPNAEIDFYERAYRQHVIDLLNSSANSAATEGEDVLG